MFFSDPEVLKKIKSNNTHVHISNWNIKFLQVTQTVRPNKAEAPLMEHSRKE